MPAELNREKYAAMIAAAPIPPKTEADYDRLVQLVRELMEREEGGLSPEEDTFLELLAIVIEDYEDEHNKLEGSTPNTRLEALMAERGIYQRELVGVFGSRAIVAEVVKGKRTISKTQAKQLAELFRVPVELFL